MNRGSRTASLVAALAGLTLAACSSDPEPAPKPLDTVFADNFGSGVRFENFSGSNAVVTVDTTEKHAGTASLKVTIPGATSYGGGAFPTDARRDLSGFNALTFWARASKDVTFDVVGLGINNQPDPLYPAEVKGLAVTTTWTKFVVPIPLAAKLAAEDGLFHFADGGDGDYTIWFDDVKYETVAGLGAPQPSIKTETVNRLVGGTVTVAETRVTFAYEGEDVVVEASPRYFTFTSSGPAATVAATGVVTAAGVGTAEITAMLGAVAASGTLTVVVGAANVPTVAAPAPTHDAADVISLFSNVYTSVPVNTWSADWDSADLAETQVAGDDVKLYTNLVFAGVEFTGANSIDATGMTHFHVDLWSTDATTFKVKLVDFGADDAFGGGDDREHELEFPVTNDQWNAIDVPLSSFTGLTTRANLSQLILSSSTATVYVDNVYFRDAGTAPPPTDPTVAAPAPTAAPADVVSLFSNVYTSGAVNTWSADWPDQADVADAQVAGDDVKLYTNLVFAGIEFTGANSVDATGMTHFHLDVWTPDATIFKVKLVDFGADNAFGGTGPDAETEHELTVPVATGQWVQLDLPLADFTGLASRAHLSQLILSSSNAKVYVDNVYFRDDGGAPPVTLDVFADDYATGVTFAAFGGSTNALAVDTAEKHAGTASLRVDVPAGGYTGGALVAATAKDVSGFDALTFWARASKAATLNGVGIGNDAGAALWAAEWNAVALGTTWTRYVVPLPLPSALGSLTGLFHFAEGAEEGAYSIWIDDVRYETVGAAVLGTPMPAIATEARGLEVGATLTVNGASVTTPVSGTNQTLAVSRRFFTWASSNESAATVDATGTVTGAGVGSTEITASLGAIPAAGVTTVNVTAPAAPATAAPTPPARAAGDVVSLFSDAYTNVNVDTWSASWDNGNVEDVTVAGNATKKYTSLVFAGVEFFNPKVNASAMTHLHVDVWTPNATKLGVKLVNFPTAGGSQEAIVRFNSGTPQTITQGEWISLDIPLTGFAGMSLDELGQLLWLDNGDAGPTGGDENGTFFVDNVYFYR